MRILDKASIQLDIPKLGFYADDLEMVNRIINYPDGIFLVTGRPVPARPLRCTRS